MILFMQKSLIASSPISLNSSTNTLSIDLTNIYNKSESGNKYQLKLSATLPNSLNSTTNT